MRFGIVSSAVTLPSIRWYSCGMLPEPPPPKSRSHRCRLGDPSVLEYQGVEVVPEARARSVSEDRPLRTGNSYCSNIQRVQPDDIEPPYRSHRPTVTGAELQSVHRRRRTPRRRSRDPARARSPRSSDDARRRRGNPERSGGPALPGSRSRSPRSSRRSGLPRAGRFVAMAASVTAWLTRKPAAPRHR